MKLAWDPNTEPDVAGYKVYYGTASRTYGPPINVGNVTVYTLNGLSPGVTYYIAVTAYDTAHYESDYSNEVSGQITETVSPPTVLTGTTSGTIGTSYTYTAGGSSSNLGHSVKYQFDWKGDGTALSPWGSATQSKVWTVAGTYNVRARAQCATHTSVVSSWSGSLLVTIAPTVSYVVTPSDALISSGNQGGPFTPSNKTYTLQNTGSSSIDWTVSETQIWTTLSSPSGTLAAGASATVTVSINSNANSLAPGSYSDTVTFTNTTNGNGNTTRLVSLTVSPSGGEIILDNAAAGQSGGGRSFTGTWCASSASGYYGTDSLYSCGSGTNTYRWTPTIPVGGSYDVYVWWTAYSTRSASVPISVTHAAGTTTKNHNEQTGGGQWVLHGNYNFNAGTGGYVEVSDINGQACADAVRFVPAGAPTEIILDNAAAGQSGGGQSFTGTWCASGALGYYGTDSLYSCGSGTNTYRWTPTIPAAGSYNVYVWWTAYSTRSTSVPIAVTHEAGTTTKNYNEQTGGGGWVLHGTYNFNAGTGGYVEVSDINGQACADAVRFEPWP